MFDSRYAGADRPRGGQSADGAASFDDAAGPRPGEPAPSATLRLAFLLVGTNIARSSGEAPAGWRDCRLKQIYDALCESLPGSPDPDYKDWSSAGWSLLRLAVGFFGMGSAWR